MYHIKQNYLCQQFLKESFKTGIGEISALAFKHRPLKKNIFLIFWAVFYTFIIGAMTGTEGKE